MFPELKSHLSSDRSFLNDCASKISTSNHHSFTTLSPEANLRSFQGCSSTESFDEKITRSPFTSDEFNSLSSIDNSYGNSDAFSVTSNSSLSWSDFTTGERQTWVPSSSEEFTPPSILNLGNDRLSADSLAAPQVQIVGGTLGADTFTYVPGFNYTVFSGNGNVSFGQGGRDVVDLSSIRSTTVSFNLASLKGGGVIFNPGNGARVFDAINFSNGSQILWEGMDSIQFADGVLELSVTPNDPGFNQQWNLQMMGVQNAWRFTTGSTNVAIGIADSGLGVSSQGFIHPDLRTNDTYVYGTNYRDDYEKSITSHGTDVQGIIAAASNNGTGMSGINWKSDVFNMDVLGGDSQDLDLAEATQLMIDGATRRGENLVINMSLGYPNSGGQTGLEPAFERTVANHPDVLFVIASGNDNVNGISYPASLSQRYSNVMAIGASWGTKDQNGTPKAPGTQISYPGVWGSNYGTGLTLMGPSEVIATSAIASAYGVTFDYDLQFDGTSAATPNVTGVASLVWSANPNLTATQVQTILSDTAYDLGARGYDTVYGHGFVNADAAVRRAIAIGAGAV
ncbi:S8 family serine peptidase [Phormidesmis priestleyi]